MYPPAGPMSSRTYELTATVVVAVTLPAVLVAVSVYAVVVVGFTAVVPVKATLPMALSMVTLVASVTLQLKVELSPAVIVVGLAEKELIMGAVGDLSLIHISEPTRRTPISYAVFCL